MTEPRNDDRSQARREAAALLNVDIDHMSPADGLRVDMVSALRLVIDHEQSCVLSGGSADLGKLNVAVQSLIALLPGRELPGPESSREDPRQEMWLIYKTMRERGELNLREPGGEELLQAKVNEQAAQIERLQARLAGGPASTENQLTDNQLPVEAMLVESVIDPPLSAITPPGEIGVAYVGTQRGPDDPPRRSPPVIEARPNPPAAPAAPAYDYTRERGWRDHVLPSGEITPTPMSGGRRWLGPV
jgi:hypothetical protein